MGVKGYCGGSSKNEIDLNAPSNPRFEIVQYNFFTSKPSVLSTGFSV